MPTLWTEADINALKAAIASGALSVEYAGPPARKITYHSLSDMRSLLADMVREVYGTRTHRLAQFDKGFR